MFNIEASDRFNRLDEIHDVYKTQHNTRGDIVVRLSLKVYY